MYHHILVATGGSAWSNAAVTYAIALAAHTGATLRIVTVVAEPDPELLVEATPAMPVDTPGIPHSQEILAAARAQAQQAGVGAEARCEQGDIATTLVRLAAAGPCDLVVLGARLITGKRLRLGDTANAVAAKVPQPVLVIKQPPLVGSGSPPGQRLLVATGGSPWSDNAVDYAIVLARHEGLSLCLLHVLPAKSRHDDVAVMDGRYLLARAETRAASAGVKTTVVQAYGDVARTIVQTAAQQHCDGIVLGARGATGWKRLMLGSIGNTVAAASPLPVLFVKYFWGDAEISG
jgi:nucleotide-binding universal stress UspA family protein